MPISEQTIDPEPTVDPEPMIEPEPTVDPAPVIDNKPIIEPKPIINPKPIIEPTPLRPVIDVTPVDNKVSIVSSKEAISVGGADVIDDVQENPVIQNAVKSALNEYAPTVDDPSALTIERYEAFGDADGNHILRTVLVDADGKETFLDKVLDDDALTQATIQPPPSERLVELDQQIAELQSERDAARFGGGCKQYILLHN